jgi:hypothetical protein
MPFQLASWFADPKPASLHHFSDCKLLHHAGTFFGKISEFNEVHRQRRSKAVRNYLDGIPDPILRAAVSI